VRPGCFAPVKRVLREKEKFGLEKPESEYDVGDVALGRGGARRGRNM